VGQEPLQTDGNKVIAASLIASQRTSVASQEREMERDLMYQVVVHVSEPVRQG
jgi:hypothetical protein